MTMTGFLDGPLITAYKKEIFLLESFSKVFFYFWKEIDNYLVFSKGKPTIYNNYKCFMGKQWMDKTIRKDSTWERTKRVIPELRFTFISSCFLIPIC